MTNAIIVGGTFDRDNGKPSTIVKMLAEHTKWPVINGGNLSAIETFPFKDYEILVWMPNIDNAEDKILSSIKTINPHLLLISSKRMVEKSYTLFDVVSRLLKSRSNLGITIESVDDRYVFGVVDPLGNRFVRTDDVIVLAETIVERVDDLRSMTRIPAISIQDKPIDIAGIDEFVTLVQEFGDEFSKHVNSINPERFLGNASARSTDRITRCCHGFPATRQGNCYLVSRRNVDKTTMSVRDFVAVGDKEDRVEYYGTVKPSVDAPIQIRLFNYYKDVKYIVHGHVYLDNAYTTHFKVPCGAIEEFDEIKTLMRHRSTSNVSINLRGHGCIIMASDLKYLREQLKHLKSRPFPEE